MIPETTMESNLFTKYDKAAGAAIGAAAATIIAYYYPMPMEVQGAVTLLLTAGMAYFVPNKAA